MSWGPPLAIFCCRFLSPSILIIRWRTVLIIKDSKVINRTPEFFFFKFHFHFLWLAIWELHLFKLANIHVLNLLTIPMPGLKAISTNIVWANDLVWVVISLANITRRWSLEHIQVDIIKVPLLSNLFVVSSHLRLFLVGIFKSEFLPIFS